MNFLQPGQEIETEIVAITDDCIFLNLNAKSEGVLDKAELADENGNLKVKEGDKIKAFFVGNQNGEMKFTVKIDGKKANKDLLENAYKSGIPVEGHVEKEIKGGFEVKIGEIRAFCPYSQMGFKQKEEPSFYIGKTLSFRIKDYKDGGKSVIVSNRSIGEEKYENDMKNLESTLLEGMTVKGKVLSIQKFGAFVEVMGFKTLLPISEVSRKRLESLEGILNEGDEIEVKVLKTDWKNEKVSVSMKALLKDPWEDAAERYPADSKIDGTISRIADFGLFVNLEDGIDGLVHISELEEAGHNTNLRKVFKTGDKMSVVVIDVNTDEKRIALKPATSKKQDNDAEDYLKAQKDDGDTYNPFASLLKKK